MSVSACSLTVHAAFSLFFLYLSAAGQASAKKTSHGERVFHDRCQNCHTTSADRTVGPGMKGILKSGRLSEDAVRRTIKEGKDLMPPFDTRLSAKDLNDLIKYLKTL